MDNLEKQVIVEELYGLTQWATAEVGPAIPLYDNLAAVLEHNMRNPQKVAVKEAYDNLENALANMHLERLTAEQLTLLEENEMLPYIGERGVNYFRSIITQGRFDPATASDGARRAHQLVLQGLNRLESLREALTGARVQVERTFSPDNGVITRLHFRDKANIGDVHELKRWSADWYDIARGLAAVAGERPEDVRVVGASTGSVVIVLSTSLVVAGILTMIAKRANIISKNVLDILNGLEDLRHKKVLNKAIEDAMKEQAALIKRNGVATAVEDVKIQFGETITQEVENQLNKAVEKYFNFTEKGGEVDMLAPPVSDSKKDVRISKEIAELNASIEEVRAVKANLQRLLANEDGPPV